MNLKLLSFYTEDGVMLKGILSKANEENDTIVVHINGRGAGQFSSMTGKMRQFYTQNKINFFSYDQRFWQYDKTAFKKEIDVGKYSVEDAQKDLKGALKFVKEMGYQNIILEGHSLGTEVATKYLNNNLDDKISKLILMSPCDHIEAAKNLFKAYQELTINDFKEAYDKALACVKEKKPDEIVLDKGKLGIYSAQQFLEFYSKQGGFNQFSYEDENTFPNITIPVITMLGQKDPLLPDIDKAKNYFNKAFLNGKTYVFDSSHVLEGEDVLDILKSNLGKENEDKLLWQRKGKMHIYIIFITLFSAFLILFFLFKH